jgi:hypothetical protein
MEIKKAQEVEAAAATKENAQKFGKKNIPMTNSFQLSEKTKRK